MRNFSMKKFGTPTGRGPGGRRTERARDRGAGVGDGRLQERARGCGGVLSSGPVPRSRRLVVDGFFSTLGSGRDFAFFGVLGFSVVGVPPVVGAVTGVWPAAGGAGSVAGAGWSRGVCAGGCGCGCGRARASAGAAAAAGSPGRVVGQGAGAPPGVPAGAGTSDRRRRRTGPGAAFAPATLPRRPPWRRPGRSRAPPGRMRLAMSLVRSAGRRSRRRRSELSRRGGLQREPPSSANVAAVATIRLLHSCRGSARRWATTGGWGVAVHGSGG